eukprot:g6419.t1
MHQGAGVRAGGGGLGDRTGVEEDVQVGSKLARVAWLLREHKERRDEAEGAGRGGKRKRSGGALRFFALVLVSARKLARAAPGILESAFEGVAAADAAEAAAAVVSVQPNS